MRIQSAVSFVRLAGGIQKDRCICIGWRVGTRGWQVLLPGLLKRVIARKNAKLKVVGKLEIMDEAR